MPANPDTPERRRVTVDYSARAYRAIEKQVAKQSKEKGYAVTVSDVLRQLVREQWGSL